MPRQSWNPSPQDRKQVKALAAYGVPQADIARVLDVDAKTLRKHCRDELDNGATEANAKVAESLYRKALGDGQGAVTAAIFWAKTRMGWRETPQAMELSGKDGGPIETVNHDADEFSSRIARLAAAKGAGQGTGEPEAGDEG